MKLFLFVFMFIVFCMSAVAQNSSGEAAQIKQQMSAIRKSTNWNDPAAAKAANAKIEELAAKLTQAIRNSKPPTQKAGNSDINPKEAVEIQQEIDDYNNKLWNQMMNIVRDGGSWDLAKPLRDEIVQEYKDDEDPTIKNEEWLETMPYLLINMSLPHIQTIINQMPAYKGVRKLIITCEKPGVPVNLYEIISNASEYPLEELHITGFGSSVSSLPDKIDVFGQLTTLAVYNNNIRNLPESISSLTGLRFLYTDLNPVASLVSVVSSLKKLKELGLAKTSIPDTEIREIQHILPNCKILLK